MFCQNYNKTDSIIKSDSVLRKIVSYFPSNWTYNFADSLFIIECKDTAWILSENRINVKNSTELKKDREERIKKTGVKGRSKIILKVVAKWNDGKRIVAKNLNSSYYLQLQNLDSKYKIDQFYDSTLSKKNSPVYSSKTAKGKETIEKYNKEKNEINAKLTVMPNYSTQNYSFFVKSLYGCNDDNHYVFPDIYSSQLYQILSIFIELGEK